MFLLAIASSLAWYFQGRTGLYQLEHVRVFICLNQKYYIIQGCHDIKHNNIEHNDIQYNYAHHKDIQHSKK